MSPFEELSGRPEDADDEGKPDMDELIASEDANSSVIELDNYIGKLCRGQT